VLRAVPPGSCLAISVPASDIQEDAQAAWTRRVAGDYPSATIGLRSRTEMTRLFDGLELVEPGVVPVDHWRPGGGGPEPARALPAWGAVGRSR
jgi:hypothetical protein